MHLMNIEWKQERGSCAWWPHNWKEVVGKNAVNVYWHMKVLGHTGHILERDTAPHYWLLQGNPGTPKDLFFDRLSDAQAAFETIVLEDVKMHVSMDSAATLRSEMPSQNMGHNLFRN